MGHVIIGLRKDKKFVKFGTDCRCEGKRSRGRRRVIWMSKALLLQKQVDYSIPSKLEMLEKAKDRVWQDKIAKVKQYGT